MATCNLTCIHCKSPFVLVTSPAIAARQKFCGKTCMSNAFKERTPELLVSLKQRLQARMQECVDGCILYTGQNNGTYGQIEYRRRTYLAHRASYMVFKGAIPKRMCVCHTCDTPLCINPDHLWLGTYAENVADMYRKDRQVFNPRKKLSDEDFARMKADADGGMVHRVIAKKYGVSQSYVSMVKNGQRRNYAKASSAAS